MLPPKLGKLGGEKSRKLLENGRVDALSTLTEHPVSLSAGGGPNISFHQAGHHERRFSRLSPLSSHMIMKKIKRSYTISSISQ